MEITRKIVKQPFAPDTTDVLWLDSSGDSDVLKSFCNGQWKETSTPQQDYKIIAPKQGRSFANDAAALVELKKAILNGIGFDCIIKDTFAYDGDLNRVLGFYPSGDTVDVWSFANSEVLNIGMPHTVTQYQGLAAVQRAIDEQEGVMGLLPVVIADSNDCLKEDNFGGYICVDNKFLIATVDGDDKLASLTMAETGPGEGDDTFVNITWEDAQKLIGLPIA